MDIEIAARRGFILHIENKIWSSEGEAQTHREWADLLLRAEQLEVPEENRRALFLTPNGDQPLNNNFIPVSWRDIADVLDKFAERAQPPVVKLFATHYARTLRTFVVPAPEREEGEDAEPAV
jgi:hypothetical protein